MDWTDAEQAELREMWDTGKHTLAIAGHFSTTKNSIVGKAHRMRLTPRPSPILPGPKAWRHASVPVARIVPKLPPLPSFVPEPVADHAPPARIVAPRPAAPVAVFVPASGLCCWPLGEPGTRSFRYCDAATGRVYCDTHHRRAHQPRRVA